MSSQLPEMQRREFLNSVTRTLPVWIYFLSAFSPDKLLADEATPSSYDPTQHNYAMGVDIHKCIGCGRCADACKTENAVPREPFYYRTWVERYIVPPEGETIVDSPNGGIDGFPEYKGDKEVLRTYFVPKLCNHCENPPCVQVCPVGATFVSRDKVVLVDESYCLGCRYCIQACPYGARYLHPVKKTADKCTFCYHRITNDLLPACVEICPTQARVFGEMGHRSSPVWRFMRFGNVSVLKAYLNTKPKVYYSGADNEVR